MSRVRRPGPSALLLPAPPEPRHQAAQPAPLLARVSGDPADRVVGLDDPQLLVRRAHGAPSGDCLGGLRAAGLGGVDLRLQAGDVVVGIGRGRLDLPLATTQAKFIRDVTQAWTSAARDKLK